MGTPTARNVAPAGSKYTETVRSNHCITDRAGVSLMGWRQCTKIWGHCTLFGLGSATPTWLFTIIDKAVSHCMTIDGACLTEDTDTSEDGGRIDSKEELRRDGPSVQMCS
ncbi:hypothetical protein TNCV_4690001 [Trichonephila clavipes]|nr:hypothetical protein TNCV_4690001 [Trichonephila clavipes]